MVWIFVRILTLMHKGTRQTETDRVETEIDRTEKAIKKQEKQMQN